MSDLVSCRFVIQKLSGRTQKFHCQLPDGRIVKVKLEEVSQPDQLRIAIDDVSIERFDSFCIDPLQQHYEFDMALPASILPGPHLVHLTLGWRKLGPVAIEVA